MQGAPEHRHIYTTCKVEKHAELVAREHLAEDGGELERGAASSALQVKRCGTACLPRKISQGSTAPAQCKTYSNRARLS